MGEGSAARNTGISKLGMRIARLVRRQPLIPAGIVLALGLAGCQQSDYLPQNNRQFVPVPGKTLALMAEKNMSKDAPILIRAYKQESELEIWKRNAEGKYALLKTFPMCRWSGQLGPKTREGDRQVPEGFYAITPSQLNPNSNYYLSFNVGYPNQLDKAYGRGGGLIMVHGACSSAGCMSMTDEQIAEIYALTRDAFTGGQQKVQMQSFPFRMTAQNLAKFRADPNIAFWKNLKEGSDHFEVTQREPQVAVCGKKYVFDIDSKGKPLDASQPCPALSTDPELAHAVAEKAHKDELKVAELVASGVKAVRKTYIDGDQHPSFRATAGIDGTISTGAGRRVEVSQLDALAVGGVETPISEPAGKTPAAPASSKVTKAPVAVATSQTPASQAPASEPQESAPVLALAAEPSLKSGSASPLAKLEAALKPTEVDPAAGGQSVTAPVTASAAPSFYQRWLGLGEDVKAEAPVAAPAPELASVPLPPRSPLHLGLKPLKQGAGKEKQAIIPGNINGGKPLGPATGKLSLVGSPAQQR